MRHRTPARPHARKGRQRAGLHSETEYRIHVVQCICLYACMWHTYACGGAHVWLSVCVRGGGVTTSQPAFATLAIGNPPDRYSGPRSVRSSSSRRSCGRCTRSSCGRSSTACGRRAGCWRRARRCSPCRSLPRSVPRPLSARRIGCVNFGWYLGLTRPPHKFFICECLPLLFPGDNFAGMAHVVLLVPISGSGAFNDFGTQLGVIPLSFLMHCMGVCVCLCVVCFKTDTPACSKFRVHLFKPRHRCTTHTFSVPVSADYAQRGPLGALPHGCIEVSDFHCPQKQKRPLGSFFLILWFSSSA